MTQKQAILGHLLSGRTITALQALRLYGCLSLRDVVYRLRLAGFKIRTIPTKIRKGIYIAQYELISSPNNGKARKDNRG